MKKIICILILNILFLPIQSYSLSTSNNVQNNEAYKISVVGPTNSSSDIQVKIQSLNIEKDKEYVLSFIAESTSVADVEVLLIRGSFPWDTYNKVHSNNKPTFSKNIRCFNITYLANTTTDDAAIVFFLGNLIEDEHNIYLSSISFTEINSDYKSYISFKDLKFWKSKNTNAKFEIVQHIMDVEPELPKKTEFTSRIMPLGDSLTYGYPSYGGYRTDLYNILIYNNLKFHFVGSLKNGPKVLPEKEHEGHGNYTSSQIAEHVTNWVNYSNPNIILLMIGTNDMCLGIKPDVCSSNIDSIIDKIQSYSKDVKIYVSSIPPINIGKTVEENVKITNILIRLSVEKRLAKGENVSFVDINNVLNINDLYMDNVHIDSNGTGNSKIAESWFGAIKSSIKERD